MSQAPEWLDRIESMTDKALGDADEWGWVACAPENLRRLTKLARAALAWHALVLDGGVYDGDYDDHCALADAVERAFPADSHSGAEDMVRQPIQHERPSKNLSEGTHNG